MRLSTIHFWPTLALLSVACVPQSKYQRAVADADSVRGELRASQDELNARAQALRELESRLERQHAERAEEAATCRKSLDEAGLLNSELRKELERLGKNVDKLLSANGDLAGSLEQSKARLEELRRAQAAAEARAALFRDLAQRLKRMVDAGELAITLRSGRMVLVLPTDVLFDSGKAVIKPAGLETLTRVGKVLTGLVDRQFQVSGHTDNVPIKTSAFPSNWELSTARALEVLGILLKSGMAPGSLSAAGYGEYDPVAPNDAPDHMAKNRRIEITVQPQIDELVNLPSSP